VIGGRNYVEGFATSDEFAAIFMDGLDQVGGKVAIEMVVRIVGRAGKCVTQTQRSPVPDERAKIRWTDEGDSLQRSKPMRCALRTASLATSLYCKAGE
jgi:hypothetical protein